MGRPRKEIDIETILEMRSKGDKIASIARQMRISETTLSRRFADLNQEGILTKYRQLQGLQLTELQARILETADSKNLEYCSLTELLRSFYVLKKAEITIQGKESSKISGLMSHLLALQEAEKEGRNG